jgi:UDP-N-acetylglucosamine 2-epimerase (non-hydrolysing)
MPSAPYRLMLIVGARPNFMKIAPIIRELSPHAASISTRLVHTGQHYDAAMSEVFFEQLGIPRPDIDLGIGSDTHARQTAAIMTAFEPIVVEWEPDMVLVVGDVNSTVACALVASKLGVQVAHVEAGLRSFDRTMPEEINRLLTDQLSDLLFVTEGSAIDNLRREGIADEKVFLVGNVMIDTLLAHRDRAVALDVPGALGLQPQNYGVLTLHRPSNVDDPQALESLFGAIETIARDLPLLFPVHPRTRPALQRSRRIASLVEQGAVRLLDPLGYLEFVGLVAQARVVLTDSGGIQEETTVLGVPCLTLRTTTERPVTVDQGTNLLVGIEPDAIVRGWLKVKSSASTPRVPQLWDGQAARRIVEILLQHASQESATRVRGLTTRTPHAAPRM